MTKQAWRILILGFLIAAIVLFCIFFFRTQSVLEKMNISPTEINRIEMQHGGTGQKVTLTNSEDIRTICNALDSITCKRRLGFGKDGFWVKVAMYQGSKQLSQCILSSGNYGDISNHSITIVKQLSDFTLVNQYFK